MRAETLDAHCAGIGESAGKRPRLLILNYPNNPTCVSYTAGELREIAIVARRHGILVLSDEIYGDINHSGSHSSIAPFYPEGKLLRRD